MQALAAGKHVLCEKPTALNAGQAHDMLEAARRSRRLALIDHELRLDPTRRRLRELVREGYLGRLQHLQLNVESEFRLDPGRPWSWWSDAAQGGGMLGAVGSHAVDAIRYTAGEVLRGRGLLRTLTPQRPDPATGEMRAVTADDYAAFWLELEGGATAASVLSAVSRSPRPGWTMSLHGSEGTLLLDAGGRLSGRRGDEKEFADLTPPAPGLDVQALGMADTPWSRAFLGLAAEIATALAEGRSDVPLAATFEDGLRSQQVLDALCESAERGEWIDCGPDAALAGRAAPEN
jgi:predicted dehydrogenase